jgi:hypothetical protein
VCGDIIGRGSGRRGERVCSSLKLRNVRLARGLLGEVVLVEEWGLFGVGRKMSASFDRRGFLRAAGAASLVCGEVLILGRKSA